MRLRLLWHCVDLLLQSVHCASVGGGACSSFYLVGSRRIRSAHHVLGERSLCGFSTSVWFFRPCGRSPEHAMSALPRRTSRMVQRCVFVFFVSRNAAARNIRAWRCFLRMLGLRGAPKKSCSNFCWYQQNQRVHAAKSFVEYREHESAARSVLEYLESILFWYQTHRVSRYSKNIWAAPPVISRYSSFSLR